MAEGPKAFGLVEYTVCGEGDRLVDAGRAISKLINSPMLDKIEQEKEYGNYKRVEDV